MKARAAAIDIGSNTTLFLAAEVDLHGKVAPRDEDQLSNGIGRDVFQTGSIAPETISRNLSIIDTLARRAEAQGAEEILIAGTSALRNAANGKDLIRRAHEALGLDITLLSGEEEARMTYLGCLSGPLEFHQPVILIDIGGGSTEFIMGQSRKVEKSCSLETGAVRITGDFPLGDPPDREKYQAMSEAVAKSLKVINWKSAQGREIILAGGTAATLAALYKNLPSYRGDAVEGAPLTAEWIEKAQSRFLEATLEERKKILRFDPDRAPVIIAGTALALEILSRLEVATCRVTHRGLRFGLIAGWALGKFKTPA